MNPQEIPQQIDLSKDVASQGIQLSPEQQKSFQEYLDTLKAEEKQTIISLTQSEIQDLKSILSNFDPRENSAGQTIASFIEQQKTEGFSLAEFAGEDSKYKEVLENTQTLVSDLLFWTEWILKEFSLSSQSQDSFATGMCLALIEEMGKNPSLIDFSGLMQEPQDISSLEALAQKMLPFALLTKEKEILSTPAGNKEVSKLHISGNGDSNAVFQNPLEAQKFITWIISGEISETNIEAYIEAQNDTQVPNIDLKAIQEMLQTNLGAIEARLKDTQTSSDPEAVTAAQEAVDAVAVAPDASEEEKLGLYELIKKFLKDIVEGFIGVWEKVFGPVDTKTEKDENQDAANTPDGTEFSVNGKKIVIQRTWVQEQIGNAVLDSQKPTQTEILSILKNFQNTDFSDAEKQAENSAQAIYAIQVALSNQGVDIGTIDGVFGPKTQEGIKIYQKNIGLTETGKIDTNLFTSLIEKITPENPEK